MKNGEVLLWLLLIVVAGFFLGYIGASGFYKEQAIERGYAQYSPTTGQWEWKEQE